MPKGSYSVHPVAAIFPQLPPDEYKELRDDIRERGLISDIVITKHEGEWKILDGQHRDKACGETGTKRRYTKYTGDDPRGIAASANLRRRHMNESQRALAAFQLATFPQGRPSKSRKPAGLTQKDAAKLAGVGLRTVQQAKAIAAKAEPEVIEAIRDGKLTLNEAEEIASLERQQQLDRIGDQRKAKRKKGEQRPDVSVATRLSTEDLADLERLVELGDAHPDTRVRAGAAVVRRLVPILRTTR